MPRPSVSSPCRPPRGRLLVTALAVFALAACGSGEGPSDDGSASEGSDGSDGSDRDTEPSGASLLPAAEGVTEYPLTVQSDAGEVVIAERPSRIAVVDVRPTSSDILLELGVTPVLAPENLAYGGWTPPSDIDAIETIWPYGEGGLVSRELLLEADPDLIVHYSNREMEPQRAEDLNQIAPTISLQEQDVPWQDTLVLLAEVLDIPSEGDRVLGEVDAVIADARDSLSEHHGKTATIAHIHPEQQIVYVSRPGRDAATLLEELGFSLSDSGAEVPEDFTISLENIDLLDADFLYVSAFAEADAAPVVESELFQRLLVVADGRTAYEFEDASDTDIVIAWGFGVPGPRSIKAVVPIVAERANEVLGG